MMLSARLAILELMIWIRLVAGAAAGFFSGFGLAIGAPQRIPRRALDRAPGRQLPGGAHSGAGGRRAACSSSHLCPASVAIHLWVALGKSIASRAAANTS